MELRLLLSAGRSTHQELTALMHGAVEPVQSLAGASITTAANIHTGNVFFMPGGAR